jgi:hypothetical protein
MTAEATGPGWQARTRLELARGHWSLGEPAEALLCLERLVAVEPAAEGLSELLEDLRDELGLSGPDDLRERLAALEKRVRRPEPVVPPASSPLATGTLASLFVDQGHAVQGLALARDVLRERPEDARARQVFERVHVERTQRVIERLERWLAGIRRSRGGEVHA